MNLQLEWIESPRTEWIDDIESMAEGYPFEKRKQDVLDENRVERCRSTWKNGAPGEFLAGFFEKKLVGWIRFRKDDFLTDRLGHEYRVADWELIQRNRDDVRGELLAAIRERYPEAIVQFSQPAQNRTARSFYLKQPDVEGGPTDLYLGRTLGKDPAEKASSDHDVRSLGPDDDLKQYIPATRSYLPCRNLLEPDRCRELLAGTLSETLRRDSTEGFSVGNGDGLLVLDHEPPPFEDTTPTGRIPYCRIPSADGPADGLLSRAKVAFDEAGVEHAEVRLDEPSQREHEFLELRGYQSLSKRMYFLRLPDGIDPPLE